MFLEKVVVAMFSSLIFSGILILSFLWQSGTETGWSILSLFLLYFIYCSPVYLIGGGLYSVFVDIFINPERFHNKYLKYITGFIAYIAGGLIIMAIWLIIIASSWDEILSNESLPMLGVGMLASILFFHISLAWRKFMNFI